jgi:hypothetical protein
MSQDKCNTASQSVHFVDIHYTFIFFTKNIKNPFELKI